MCKTFLNEIIYKCILQRTALPCLSPSTTPQGPSVSLFCLLCYLLHTSHRASAVSWFVGLGYCVTKADGNTARVFLSIHPFCTVIRNTTWATLELMILLSQPLSSGTTGAGSRSFSKCLWYEAFYPAEACSLTIWFYFLPYQLCIVVSFLSSLEKAPHHSVQKSPPFLPSGTFATLCLCFGK